MDILENQNADYFEIGNSTSLETMKHFFQDSKVELDKKRLITLTEYLLSPEYRCGFGYKERWFIRIDKLAKGYLTDNSYVEFYELICDFNRFDKWLKGEEPYKNVEKMIKVFIQYNNAAVVEEFSHSLGYCHEGNTIGDILKRRKKFLDFVNLEPEMNVIYLE